MATLNKTYVFCFVLGGFKMPLWCLGGCSWPSFCDGILSLWWRYKKYPLSSTIDWLGGRIGLLACSKSRWGVSQHTYSEHTPIHNPRKKGKLSFGYWCYLLYFGWRKCKAWFMMILGAFEPLTYCLDPTRVQTHVSVARQMTAGLQICPHVNLRKQSPGQIFRDFYIFLTFQLQTLYDYMIQIY